MLNHLNNIRMAQALQHIDLALSNIPSCISWAPRRFLRVDCLHRDGLPCRLVQRAPNDSEPTASQGIAELVVQEYAGGSVGYSAVAIEESWSCYLC